VLNVESLYLIYLKAVHIIVASAEAIALKGRLVSLLAHVGEKPL
jgi:hypothetical protein